MLVTVGLAPNCGATESISGHQKEGTIIRVLDRNTLQPVPFAQLTIQNERKQELILEADAKGICRSSLIAGSFKIKVIAENYLLTDTTVVFKRDEDEVTIFLRKIYLADSAVTLTVGNQQNIVKVNIVEHEMDDLLLEEAPVSEVVKEATIDKKILAEPETVATDSIQLKLEVLPQVVEPDYAPVNLVFLIDCSSSMKALNRVSLAKLALVELAKTLRPEDKLAIITYSNEAQVALGSTFGHDSVAIFNALKSISAGGLTKTNNGLELAYAEAVKGFIAEGLNRVMLISDGSFQGNTGKMENLIVEHATRGIGFSAIGIKNQGWTESEMKRLVTLGRGEYITLQQEENAGTLLKEQIKISAGLLKDGK